MRELLKIGHGIVRKYQRLKIRQLFVNVGIDTGDEIVRKREISQSQHARKIPQISHVIICQINRII